MKYGKEEKRLHRHTGRHRDAGQDDMKRGKARQHKPILRERRKELQGKRCKEWLERAWDGTQGHTRKYGNEAQDRVRRDRTKRVKARQGEAVSYLTP